MSRLLLITGDDEDVPHGGRAQLSRLHHQCLAAIFGETLTVRRLRTGAAGPRMAALRGYIDGLTPTLIGEVIDQCRRDKVTGCFLDGSNLGRLAAAVRHALPNVQLFTFCHNVEARFFWGAFRTRPTPHAGGVAVANYVAERAAVRASDRLIALSERDSSLFARLYSRAATDILPLSIEDQLSILPNPSVVVAADAPALFVGGAFYANKAGIAWYAREVAPRLPIRTQVVGQGMAAMRAELEAHGNIEVIGAVDRLEQWYRGARIVVAPIFDGSGMKTKVAEALMFGKRVAGTTEAFSGYEAVSGEAGSVCNNADAYVAAIEAALRVPIPECDPHLRQLYERCYSREAMKSRLARILGVG